MSGDIKPALSAFMLIDFLLQILSQAVQQQQNLRVVLFVELKSVQKFSI